MYVNNPMNSQLANASNMGIAAGAGAGGQLSAAQTYQMLNQQGVTLSPQQQAALQQQMANEAANSQLQQQAAAQGMSAGLANAAANTNAQRQMAIAAQANAAQNVANQLGALQQNRATNASMIANAANTAAGMFR